MAVGPVVMGAALLTITHRFTRAARLRPRLRIQALVPLLIAARLILSRALALSLCRAVAAAMLPRHQPVVAAMAVDTVGRSLAAGSRAVARSLTSLVAALPRPALRQVLVQLVYLHRVAWGEAAVVALPIQICVGVTW